MFQTAVSAQELGMRRFDAAQVDLQDERFVELGLTKNEAELIAVGMLGTVGLDEHYQGPQLFREVIDVTELVRPMRANLVASENRWASQADLDQKKQEWNQAGTDITVQVLSFKDERLKQLRQTLTRLANKKDEQVNRGDVQTYHAAATEIFTLVSQQRPPEKPELPRVATALLRGGEIAKPYFPVNGDRQLNVEAKRLNDQHHNVLAVGLDGWQNLELVAALGPTAHIELQFADDCLASAATICATILALYERHLAGDFPKIEKISVYGVVAAQQGVEALVKVAQELNIPLSLVVGDLVYGLDQRLYLEELDEVTGQKRAVVGDMGSWLSRNPADYPELAPAT